MEPINATIEFESGFMIGSGYGLAGLLDDTVLKTPDGLPYIPGTSLKGVIRAACEEISKLGIATKIKPYPDYQDLVRMLADLKNHGHDANDLSCHHPVDRIFGTPFCPAAFAFSSATLNITDPEDRKYVSQHAIWQETHNSISQLGTAIEDHLFSHEIVTNRIQRDIPYKFEFTITPAATPGNPPEDSLTSLLICGLLFTDRIGANKSRGKGAIKINLPPSIDKRTRKDWIKLTIPGEG